MLMWRSLLLLAFLGGWAPVAWALEPGPAAGESIAAADERSAAPSSARETPRACSLLNWKARAGDDPGWALPGQDDSGWERLRVEGGLRRRGAYWLRDTLELPSRPDESDPLTLSIYNLPSAFEVYWDGELVGKNGRWAPNRGDEEPGATRFLLILGSLRTEPGRHLLAIRVSNHHVRWGTIHTAIKCGPLSDILGSLRMKVDQRLVALGLYFIAGLFSLFLFIRKRQSAAFLLFGSHALFFFLQGAYIYGVESLGLRVHAFALIEPVVIFGIPVAFALLIAFILWHFHVRRRGLHFAILAVMALAVATRQLLPGVGVPIINAIFVTYGLGLSVALALRKRRGSGLALAGMAVLAAYHVPGLLSLDLLRSLEMQSGFFNMAMTGAFLSFFMGLIALKIRDENRRLQALQVRSQRLEAELLKKSIQPHFIMNTLLSIQSWFNRDPAKAGKLIEALAEEFRIINRIASKPEIDIGEEIELCRSHLELMGYRRNAVYRLDLEGDLAGLKIPPMLFHTLIENGLTHAFEAGENGSFRLVCVRTGEAVEYRLENGGSLLAGLGHQDPGKTEEGMGLKYVRTRLEESFPGRWELDYGLKDGLWRVRIVIRATKAR